MKRAATAIVWICAFGCMLNDTLSRWYGGDPDSHGTYLVILLGWVMTLSCQLDKIQRRLDK